MSTDLRATYRLQLNADFDLEKAADLADYLADLDISHLYSSPILEAAPGSAHGYDVINHGLVSEERGGFQAFDRLSRVLRRNGLGQVLDIVPNHMAIGTSENPWWWDVMENGPSSRYASYFDVEWDSPEDRQRNQILVPVLGDHYGRVLEAGELTLDYEENGGFRIHYYEHVYPVDPRSWSLVLGPAAKRIGSDRLAFLAEAFGKLPLSTATDRASAQRRSRDQAVLRQMLQQWYDEEPAIAGAIRDEMEAIKADPDRLDQLLGLQNYRLAFWRITRGELSYRRFFNINTLIGLRMEDEQVYEETHRLIHYWLEREMLDGLRIDHPDGMVDPEQYFQRLHERNPDAWIVIEKILEEDEDLPADWPVDGTTGYDFLNRLNGLLVDPAAEQPLTEFYAEFTGESTDYEALVYEKKHLVMRDVLGSDVNRLTSLFQQVCMKHRRHRDYIRQDLRDAIREVAVCLPVYRTYVRPAADEVHKRDRHIIERAIDTAKKRRPDLDESLFDFFCDLLLLRVRGALEDELVQRFQQFTGPVMAKGVEDTTFYVYNRFVSLNEVGGNPGQFGLSVSRFHEACQRTQQRWPRTMLATSTHDTKRSEDVRARLNALSVIPDAWRAAVTHWAEHNERHRSHLIDRNTEYLLYQTLVGAWPIGRERALGYMEKAIREAKVHTSWSVQNQAYEQAVADFVTAALADEQFTASVARFVDEHVREQGWINALAQTLIKLTAPGVPDIYQGTELWDLSLVDPDNRRPVDYAQRRRLLAELNDAPSPEAIWRRAAAGLPKLWVVRQTLALRQRHPHWFGTGDSAQSSYEPIPVHGADNVIAFARGGRAISVAPIRSSRAWGDATVAVPEGTWTNELTGDALEGGAVPVADLFARFPVCLLSKR